MSKESNINECTECGWIGSDKEKVSVPDKVYEDMWCLTCPSCGCNEFYVTPTNKLKE